MNNLDNVLDELDNYIRSALYVVDQLEANGADVVLDSLSFSSLHNSLFAAAEELADFRSELEE